MYIRIKKETIVKTNVKTKLEWGVLTAQ